MNVAGPLAPEADLSTAERQKRSHQAFRAALDLRDKIRDCALFPPEFDLSKVCPCAGCTSKIERLKEFEIEIKSKKQLVKKHFAQLDKKELLCLNLSTSAWCTNRMFHIFHNELKAVSEKSGVALTHEKSSSSAKHLGDTDRRMRKMLVAHAIVRAKPEEPYVADDAEYDIIDEIDTGRFYYGQTKAKATADRFLDEIEAIQNKKIAEAHNQMLQPSITKNYVEKQIELVKKLPVQELESELAELISEIHPIDEHKERDDKALEYISITCYAMIKKMKELQNVEHISDGWEQKLHSLINEIILFEDEWKEKYAPIYTPHDRTDPKRQATK